MEDRILELLATVARATLPNSASITSTYQQTSPGGDDEAALQFEVAYVQQFDPDNQSLSRRLDSQIRGQPRARVTSYADQGRCANLRYAADGLGVETISISRSFGHESTFGFSESPVPFKHYFVGRVPLHQAIPKGKVRADEIVLGRRCIVLQFDAVRPGPRSPTLTYAIDPINGIPLKVSSYKDAAMLEAKTPSWVWSATSLDRTSGYPIAKTSQFDTYWYQSTGDKTVPTHGLHETFAITSASFDEAVPHGSFWPVLPPGVTVEDAIAGRTYVVPGGPETARKAGTAEPIRVSNSSGASLAYPLLGISFGVVSLILAFFLWKRSR